MKIKVLAILMFEFFFMTTHGQKLMELLSSEKTGIRFQNTIKENSIYNHVAWDYVYNGGGVATGDLNNDGLPEIFFTGNQVENKLYLNKGNFKFEDISLNLGLNIPKGWSSGVSMVDINADGWLDIYVCRSGQSSNSDERRNLLFINNHNLSFTEKAQEYGLADSGFSIQAAFLDYDQDGDLDCFVLNQPPSNNREKLNNKTSQSVCTEYSNKLYQNNNNKFIDVTNKAGLESCSYGLGVSIADLNQDGWPDIYVSNDYFVSDFVYLNQKNGIFINKDSELFKHESLYAMGVDIADFNNDGLPDVFTADMSAADHYRNKANMASMNTQRFDEIITHFNHQYMFNALQLNRGNGKFSEIAQYSGVANTDWSWSSLFIDLDNDSYKDLLVSNGIKRDIRFVDGMNKTREMMASGQIKLSDILGNIPSQKLKNYAFQNTKALKFKNKAEDWGMDQPSFSNGMAYADLDNDGDQDLVVSNVDDFPFIYKNHARQNYLKINLVGDSQNQFCYGAKATIYYGKGQLQMLEIQPTKGFISSVDPALIFGLASYQQIDSLKIEWNNSQKTLLKNIKANQTLKISKKNSKLISRESKNDKLTINPIFKEKIFSEIKHTESQFNDFEKEVLLPNKLSEIGPAMAVADFNRDGLDDLFMGNANGKQSILFSQTPDGNFIKSFFEDQTQEKTKALVLDINKDNWPDLYVGSASNEFQKNAIELQDKIYLNINGKLIANDSLLPSMRTSTGAIAFNPITETLFVGGMMQQQKYPFSEPSYFIDYWNSNKLDKSTSVFSLVAKMDLGILRDAIWTDYDNDNDLDLLAVGEWTGIQVIENQNGTFVKKDIKSLEQTNGFWHSIKAHDFDKDGDQDYVLGNLGLNNKFKKDSQKKFHVFSDDFDQNGINDVVLAKNDEKGTLLPIRGRECSSQQMPFISQKIKTFDEFAKSNLNEIYSSESLSKALHYEIHEMGSIYLENLGNGEFSYKLLPAIAQFSVINDMLIEDFDGDGKTDILAVGNKYEAEVETARYDASIGVFLKGDGNGNFEAIDAVKSGFWVQENSRNLAKIKIKDKNFVVVGINNGNFKFFEIR